MRRRGKFRRGMKRRNNSVRRARSGGRIGYRM